jgi:hypothetical protein
MLLGILLRAVIATLYTVIYGFCALMAAGAGHGTVLFLLPLLTWIFYLVAFVFLDKLGRRAFIVLMTLHYGHLLLLTWVLLNHGLDPNDIKYWNSEPGIVVFSAIVYLIGQAAAWVLFAVNRPHQKVFLT